MHHWAGQAYGRVEAWALRLVRTAQACATCHLLQLQAHRTKDTATPPVGVGGVVRVRLGGPFVPVVCGTLGGIGGTGQAVQVLGVVRRRCAHCVCMYVHEREGGEGGGG